MSSRVALVVLPLSKSVPRGRHEIARHLSTPLCVRRHRGQLVDTFEPRGLMEVPNDPGVLQSLGALAGEESLLVPCALVLLPQPQPVALRRHKAHRHGTLPAAVGRVCEEALIPEVPVEVRALVRAAGRIVVLQCVRSALVEACKSDEKSRSWVDTEIDRIRNAGEAV